MAPLQLTAGNAFTQARGSINVLIIINMHSCLKDMHTTAHFQITFLSLPISPDNLLYMR